MNCSTIHIACMQWPEVIEPICAGANKRQVTREAVRLLRMEHGDGDVPRRGAMCSVPITASDIEVLTIPVVSNTTAHQRREAAYGDAAGSVSELEGGKV